MVLMVPVQVQQVREHYRSEDLSWRDGNGEANLSGPAVYLKNLQTTDIRLMIRYCGGAD